MTSGLLLVDKPAGISSHGAVAQVRRALSERKVGHSGTLDPMATGLLVLGVGRATKLLTYLVGEDKTYTATIALGAATDTDDALGEVTATADASALSLARVEEALAGLRGTIQQVPSTYSAIKIDGQRAYARARAGADVQLPERAVTVHRLDVVAFRQGQLASLDVVVECSAGTYVRALARDLGAALGVGGHLTALRRTRVGTFEVSDAVAPDAVSAADVRALEVAAGGLFPTWEADPATVRALGFGQQVAPPPAGSLTAVYDGAALVALVRPDGRPELVFRPA